MSRVRYVKSVRDLERDSVGNDALNKVSSKSSIRSIRCVYETDAEVAQAVVPKPLEAVVGSEIHVSFACVSTQVSPDVTLEIRLASFGVKVDYDETPGIFLLAMPMNSEDAVVAGRERFGLPRKLADVEFDVTDQSVSASVERMGFSYLGARASCVEERPARTETEYVYSFKAFPSCIDGKGFDQDPQLVRLELRHDYARSWRLDGELLLQDSPFDPVADLPVRRVIDFEYTEGSIRRTARYLRPVPGEWLLPYLHQRYDDPLVEGIDV